jgi:hypothetical protein
MTWRDAVLSSLRTYCQRHSTRIVTRQAFIAEEMTTIESATGTQGATPRQTLSRVLQDLRDERLLEFLGGGGYVLLDSPIRVEDEDLPDEAIDHALRANRLRIGIVATDSQRALARQRRGQARIRQLTVENYCSCCAVCDIAELPLLIASHIVGWAEAPEHRGNLANVICLCRIHDTLFEAGYWSLDDRLRLLKRRPVSSKTIRLLLDAMTYLERPRDYAPHEEFLKHHREIAGLA